MSSDDTKEPRIGSISDADFAESAQHYANEAWAAIKATPPLTADERAELRQLRLETNPHQIGSLANNLASCKARIAQLEAAIKKHHDQHADDLCWMDDNELYAAVGLPLRDNTVGDECAMLENCKRFIKQRCQPGGEWKSYAQLEAELATEKNHSRCLSLDLSKSYENERNLVSRIAQLKSELEAANQRVRKLEAEMGRINYEEASNG